MKNSFLKYLGLPLIITTSVIPVVFWVFAAPITSRFINLNAISASLGQITGLLGMAMFACVIVLGAKYQMIDLLFENPGDLSKKHHFFGSLSFILILFHPLLLVVRYLAFSMQSAGDFFLLSSYWPRNFGIIALFFMILSFVFIYYIKASRKIWLLSHQLLGLAFLLAATHVFYSSTTFSTSPGLKIFMYHLWALAIFSSIYKIIKNILKNYQIKSPDLDSGQTQNTAPDQVEAFPQIAATAIRPVDTVVSAPSSIQPSSPPDNFVKPLMQPQSWSQSTTKPQPGQLPIQNLSANPPINSPGIPVPDNSSKTIDVFSQNNQIPTNIDENGEQR